MSQLLCEAATKIRFNIQHAKLQICQDLAVYQEIDNILR